MSRITVTNLKIAKFASEETLCMRCSVHFDGVLIGTGVNDGRGGQTILHAATGASDTAYAAALKHAEETKHFDGIGGLIDEAVEQADFEKRCAAAVKRHLKKSVLIVKDHTVRGITPGNKAPLTDAFVQMVADKNPGWEVLNRLPLDKAVARYTAAQSVSEAA